MQYNGPFLKSEIVSFFQSPKTTTTISILGIALLAIFPLQKVVKLQVQDLVMGLYYPMALFPCPYLAVRTLLQVSTSP